MLWDLVAGKIYWSESRVHSDFFDIRRANLDGSEVEDVTTQQHLAKAVAVDPNGEKVYWVGSPSPSGGQRIYRANLDGSNAEEIAPPLGATPSVKRAAIASTARSMKIALTSAVDHPGRRLCDLAWAT